MLTSWTQVITQRLTTKRGIPTSPLKSRPIIDSHPIQQDVIAHDYGMTNGQLKLTVRAKLAPYLLQLLNLNVGKQLEDARAQQIVLANYDEISPWLI